MCTIVTAFFDINRSTNGDGRTIEEYLLWIKKTLELNCNLFIITEEKFKTFFEENRPLIYKDQTYIHIMKFTESHYYKYYEQISQIINSTDYKDRIKHPNRVECILPEYNIIQYSKFNYLQLAIKMNIFNTEYFLWSDAGISRFFVDVDLTLEYPSKKGLDILKHSHNKFIIQNRYDLYEYRLDDNFIWNSDNLLSGGMFGGTPYIINKISNLVEELFQNKMLNNSNVNNEQLALALVWKDNKDLFNLIHNHTNYHLILFKYLS